MKPGTPFIMLIGLPGSGKTTYARSLLQRGIGLENYQRLETLWGIID